MRYYVLLAIELTPLGTCYHDVDLECMMPIRLHGGEERIRKRIQMQRLSA